MVWTILQTIGGLLSGLSIFVAFLLYKKERNESYIKDIRGAIADARATLSEQYQLLQTKYIYSYAEEYFSNSYVQLYINDLGLYIENHLDKSLEQIKEYWGRSISSSQLLELPILHQNTVHNQYNDNNRKITRNIIYDLADLKALIRLLSLYQREVISIDTSIEKKLTNSSFGINEICDVLINNKAYINNGNAIKRKLIQRYIDVSQVQYNTYLRKLQVIYDIIDVVLSKLFALEDAALQRYIKSSQNEKFYAKKTLQEELEEVINSIPNSILGNSDKTACGRKIGNLDSVE